MCLDRVGLLLLRLSSSYESSGAVLYPSHPGSLPSRCNLLRKFLAIFFFMSLDRVGFLLLWLSSSSGSTGVTQHPSHPNLLPSHCNLIVSSSISWQLWPENGAGLTVAHPGTPTSRSGKGKKSWSMLW
jgi:hypothetical protein